MYLTDCAMICDLPTSKVSKGLNDDGHDSDIKRIRQGVEQFRNWLTYSKIYSNNGDYQKMIEQIDKYWDKLFSDSISIDTPLGAVRIQPQRTNNSIDR